MLIESKRFQQSQVYQNREARQSEEVCGTLLGSKSSRMISYDIHWKGLDGCSCSLLKLRSKKQIQEPENYNIPTKL